ncbi:hypothetical protein GPJ56_009549 [Histomonas meleagridis]|uniref:uncharacterized protein n=1 Tax=Histomonas meleagridis TaxID=135588 RepID=UPI0035595D38|nr:hypothetical protein GPJ56_009549 [Histomonas meleagridis]KAH0797169.1 hypothetical protein GO595_010027 [Histomonas meleagridis]
MTYCMFSNFEILTDGEMKKTETKLEIIEKLSEAIEKIISDDEILIKIAINFAHKLNDHLDANEEINGPLFDSTKIAEYCWPYAKDPPTLEDLSVPKTFYQTKELKKGVSSDFETEILSNIQKAFGKKVKMSDLRKIASIISKKTSIPLKKRYTKSKKRIIEWMYVNWEKVEPHLKNTIVYIQET